MADISQRIDTFARLSAEQTEFTREIAAASRRQQVEQQGAHQAICDRLDRLERALATIEKSVQSSNYVFLGDTTGLATVDHGHRLFIDTRDRQLTPHLATNGRWEEWNARLLRQVLRPGDVVIDGGSSFGYFVTLAAELVGRSGHVHAFEANGDVARLLSATVEINGFAGRVTVMPIALADRKGSARFIARPDRLGDGALLEHTPGESSAAGAVDVPTDTLDTVMPTGSSVRLIHLDIEGAEAATLRGARRVIDQSPQLVLLIEWGRYESELTELRLLLDRGFALWIMRHDGPPAPIELADVAASGLCDLLLYRGTLADLGYAAQ